MMAAYIQAAVFLSFYSSLSGAAQNAGFLHRSRSHNTVGAGLGFRYSMKDPVAQTLLTLDTDRNGRIEPNEIKAYARMQGMDADAATEEFSSIDTNGDGVLDSMELQRALGTAATQANPSPPVVQPQPQQLSQELPVMPAFADPIIPELDEDSLSLSNTPSPTFVSAMNAYAQNVAVAPQLLSKIEVSANSQVPLPSLDQQTVSEKLANSQVSPPSVGGQESSANILAEESRHAVLAAAQRVSEQLILEESEERQARDLDWQAADYRSKSIALAKQTAQDALDAGAKAANENADALLAKIAQLEDQAQRAEVKAAALSAKSKMELEEANSYMAVANKAMQTTPEKHA